MNYTKGEWKADKFRQVIRRDYEAMEEKVICFVGLRGHIEDDEDEANAHLIVAAVNACQSVNSDNPMAVAMSIKDMYEALRKAWSLLATRCHIPVIKVVADMCGEALSKVEGKDNAIKS